MPLDADDEPAVRPLDAFDNSIIGRGANAQFGTDAPELMEIYAGKMEVLLPDADEWITVVGGESFEVAGNAKFQLKVSKLADYCCSFLE